jgi:hypothetical protein
MKFFYFKTKVVQFVQKWWNRFFGTEVIESVAKISEERTVQEEYAWRGLMIDTARHMPSVEWLRHKVDEMSLLA